MRPEEIQGYAVEGELGEGAMSVVYRVTRAGETFALKWMTERPAGEALDTLLQFRREAAALARLDHEALVRVVEVGEEDGRPFIVMDLLDGLSVDRRVEEGPMPEVEVVAMGRAVASALVEVHRFGMVHRDIKPANVVRTRSGGVKLIDFGLVSGGADSGAVVGTLHYAAPEQVGVIKRAVGPGADLYALGASLFECIAGRPPLIADVSSELLQKLAAEIPPNLRELQPETTAAFAAMVAKLLSKDPDDRYRSARGLLADLDALGQLNEEAEHGTLTLGRGDGEGLSEQEIALVGRDTELARLKKLVAAAAAGHPAFVQIEGEEGSGKTRLMQELASVAGQSGAVVLLGRCQSGETVPFGPLREAVDEHVAAVLRLPDVEKTAAIAHIRHAAGAYAALVKRLSSGLARLIGDVPELRALDPDAEQQRYYDALAGFFRAMGAADHPAVLGIDDVQWLDEGSLRVLGRVASGIRAPGTGGHLLVVSTARNLAAYRPAVGHYADAVGKKALDKLELRPLSKQAVTELVAARLGGKPLADELIEKLSTLTHGNPFAIGQYLRALLDGGLVRPVAGRWVAAEGALDGAALSKNVMELMVGRLMALGGGTTHIAGVAGVIGLRFDAGLLARVPGLTTADIQRAISELSHADLVEHVAGEVYLFVHDRVRAAAVEALSEEQERDAHEAIAEALDADALARGDTANLYAIARHYAHGHVSKNPRRACERNLAAGLQAIDEHANEEAFTLLDRARELAVPAGIYDTVAMQLLEGLGRACAMTGRLESAFAHLKEALARAQTPADRFRLQYLLTLSYASQGRNDDALASLYQAFDVVGRPFPKSLVMQIITMVWASVLGNVFSLTGIGYGSAKGAERDRRTTLSQLHYTGSMIALFQGKPVLMGQFIVRDFLNVHFLGNTGDAAIATTVYGAALGLAGLSRLLEFYCARGIKMAEELGDNAALSVCRAYHAVGTKWAGDLVKGNQMLVEALPLLDRHVPGSWYQAMMITEQAYSFLHGGLTTSAVEHIRASVTQLDRTNNLMFRYNTMSVLYCELMVSGALGEAQPLWERLEGEFKPLSNTVYVGLARCIASLEVLVDREDTGPEVDEQIAGFQQLLSEDYYSNIARVLAGHARMHQFQAAKGEERVAARKRFEHEAFGLWLRAMVPVFRCHALLFYAVLAREDGNVRKAKRLLNDADRMAVRCGSKRGAFGILLERARLAAQTGDAVSGYYAGQALEIAQAEKWRQRVRRVRSEFGLKEERAAGAGHRATQVASTVAGPLNQSQRYADALLQVSLASGSTLDPDAQAKNALGELIKVLGAERAMFFLLTESGDLVLKASVGAGTEKISQTIVRKVIEGRAPIVLTGSEDGEALGSKSIVAYGLRSIIAAPLMVRDRLIGVVYLDSRLAKGMFTEDDVSLLLGVSNHIAIAVETARTARLEAEKIALSRDMEILGAVQTLLLPKTATFEAPGVRGAGFYQATAQSGGDWWWQHTREDGTTIVVLGDVSGHGAGPAMVTSAVAGAFHAVCDMLPSASPPDILKHLHARVKAFKGYHMTMSMGVFDPKAKTLSWWNAAGPEIYVIQGGKSTVLNAAGTTLGTASPFTTGSASVTTSPGDRFMFCTDGVLELKRDGRVLGNRQTSKMFASYAKKSISDACNTFGADLNAMLVGQEQEDDITFIMLEVTE